MGLGERCPQPPRDLGAGQRHSSVSAQDSGPHWALCLRGTLILACPWLRGGEAPGHGVRRGVLTAEAQRGNGRGSVHFPC